ncbi:hypothetical protein [Enterovirga sp.]|uniref:COG3904 family protein n=1 Tax=Enterovirga sp. TaxID=2026350 RepID=UPI00262148EC|nr:hypothetical protein [Enterovirga sp.]MDB5592667.1 hypothetical protein [Enterovirga sp.]
MLPSAKPGPLKRLFAPATLAAIAVAALLVAAVCGALVAVWMAEGPGLPHAAGPARLELASRIEIRLRGEIGEGTAHHLRQLLRAHPEVRLLSLSSDGGLVDEAEQMGDTVAALGLSTYVPDGCLSACTLVFVRGRERLVASSGRLGFHAPWEWDETGSQPVEVSAEQERQAYVAAGIAPDFAAEAVRVPSSDMWYPERERLIAAGVATDFVDSADLPDRLARLPPQRRRAAALPAGRGVYRGQTSRLATESAFS